MFECADPLVDEATRKIRESHLNSGKRRGRIIDQLNRSTSYEVIGRFLWKPRSQRDPTVSRPETALKWPTEKCPREKGHTDCRVGAARPETSPFLSRSLRDRGVK